MRRNFVFFLVVAFFWAFIAKGKAEILKFRLSAVNLPSKDYGGLIDPYVKAYSKSDTRSYTKFGESQIVHNTRNPVWDEVFQFRYVRGKNQKLKFIVKDWDLGWNEDDTLGRVEIKVNDMVKALRRKNGKGGILGTPIKLYLASPRGGVLYFVPVS
ncbi:unnamed protein product [Allacma fusca]|uniref:C2 domain-containing protein n=1 Tax=Allacma fusca TaxID=39272 RepID=A0A8J2JHB0_9HEXA|nr:unnamed protein product [Allacma fusca]